MDQLVNILAEDNELIPYRKSLRKLTGSVTSSILLQQLIHRGKSKNWEPFYKFKSPCSHKLYQDGDSWTEELGFSIKEFDTALGKIGTKATKKVDKSALMNGSEVHNIITYWTDSSRITWYYINKGLLAKLLKGIYLNAESAFSKTTKGHLPITESPQRKPEGKPKKKQPPPDEQKPKTEIELGKAIIEACKINLTKANIKQVRQTVEHCQKNNIPPPLIIEFGEWFNTKHWPGKYPNPAQIVSEWPKFEDYKKNGITQRKDNKDNGHIPTTLSKAQAAAYERINQERIKEAARIASGN